MHILVAEDDPDIANLIARYLQKAGWTTHVVSSGTEALAAAREQHVDVAVLDIMLPELSGLDLCRILRREPATARIDFIAPPGGSRGTCPMGAAPRRSGHK